MQTFVRRAVVLACFFLAFVVNPAYVAGCVSSSEDDSARTSEAYAELLAMFEDINDQGSWTFEDDGEQLELLLELRRADVIEGSLRVPAAAPAFMPVAYACGQHTFYQSASACITSYQLAVEGSFTLRRMSDGHAVVSDAPVRGVIEEWEGLQLDFVEGRLALQRVDPGNLYVVNTFVASSLGDDSFDVTFERVPRD